MYDQPDSTEFISPDDPNFKIERRTGTIEIFKILEEASDSLKDTTLEYNFQPPQDSVNPTILDKRGQVFAEDDRMFVKSEAHVLFQTDKSQLTETMTQGAGASGTVMFFKNRSPNILLVFDVARDGKGESISLQVLQPKMPVDVDQITHRYKNTPDGFKRNEVDRMEKVDFVNGDVKRRTSLDEEFSFLPAGTDEENSKLFEAITRVTNIIDFKIRASSKKKNLLSRGE